MRLAVVIPVHGSPACLAACLRAIASSTRSPDEVIVVDDGSPEDSAAAIACLAANAGAALVRQPQSGPAAARNRGARETSADILVFLDSDVEIHPDALARFGECFQDSTVDAVFGSYDDEPSAGTLVSDYRNLLHHHVHQTSHRKATTFWAGCGAIRREAFQSCGGFDTGYGRPCIEDVELGLRLASEGRRIELCREIQCKHAKSWSLRSFFLTDLRDRAIPWTELLWTRRNSMPADLNFRWGQRLSVALGPLLPLGLIFLLRVPWLGAALIAACLILLPLLNRGFFGFLRNKRGAGFALAALPLHFLHLLASFLGLAAGSLAIWHRRDPRALYTAVLLLAGMTGWQVARGSYTADFGGYPDEPGHYVTGLMVAEYARHPVWPPMAFAEQYYLHYPKVALGHWPPLFYIAEGAWFLLFGSSRISALAFVTGFAWLLLVCVYALARRYTGYFTALGATLLLAVSFPFQGAMAWVMVDGATALLTIGAAAAFGAYLERPGVLPGQLFGALAGLALLTKGNAIPLAILPPLAIAWSRRWTLVSRWDLWLSILPVLFLAGPWYLFSRRFRTPNDGAFGYGNTNLVAPWIEYGWPLLLLGLAALFLLPKRDALLASLCGLASAFLLSPLAVRAFQEGRHLLPAAAAFAILGAAACQRLPRSAMVMTAALALALLLSRAPLGIHPGAFRAWAASSPDGLLLVSGSASQEGAVVAAIAERYPAPRFPVVRASSVLVASNWNGTRYRLRVQNRHETLARMKELGVAAVVQVAAPRFPHDELLDAATRDWPRQANGGFTVALNPNPVPADFALDQPRLGRKLVLAGHKAPPAASEATE